MVTRGSKAIAGEGQSVHALKRYKHIIVCFIATTAWIPQQKNNLNHNYLGNRVKQDGGNHKDKTTVKKSS